MLILRYRDRARFDRRPERRFVDQCSHLSKRRCGCASHTSTSNLSAEIPLRVLRRVAIRYQHAASTSSRAPVLKVRPASINAPTIISPLRPENASKYAVFSPILYIVVGRRYNQYLGSVSDINREAKRPQALQKFLEGRKREILQESNAARHHEPEAEEAYADPTDRAALESDRTLLLRMRDRERKLLTKINEAVARIETARTDDAKNATTKSESAPEGATRHHPVYRL